MSRWTFSSVGMIAWWSDTRLLSTKRGLSFLNPFWRYSSACLEKIVSEMALILSGSVGTMSSVMYLESVLGYVTILCTS